MASDILKMMKETNETIPKARNCTPSASRGVSLSKKVRTNAIAAPGMNHTDTTSAVRSSKKITTIKMAAHKRVKA